MSLNLSRLLACLLAAATVGTAHAGPASDALGQCLQENTSGKERKDLARWIFVAMSAHPDIGSIARPSAATAEQTERVMGALFTRLVSEACPLEMRAVVTAEGIDGTKAAFAHLGRMAMQELTAEPRVARAVGGFEKYVDMPKVERALK